MSIAGAMQPSLIARSAQAARQSSAAWSTVLRSRSVACASGGDGIAPPDVQRLAQLAQIGVTAEEAAAWGPKIEGIVEWFGQLQEVDLEGVPPALRANLEDGNALRADESREFEAR